MNLWEDYNADLQWARDRASLGVWLTAEGEEVLIRDMTTQHIKNCIAMLQKHGDEEKYISIFEQELEKRKDNE